MQQMDIDKLDRRMPYRVPDSFFDDFENKIIAETDKPRIAKRINIKRLLLPAGIVAATAAILLTVNIAPSEFDDSADYYDIALVFDNLSDDDRTCLIDAFQDDIFINQ